MSHIGAGDDYAMKLLLDLSLVWSQDIKVDLVAGDDVVELLALRHQLHPAREP